MRKQEELGLIGSANELANRLMKAYGTILVPDNSSEFFRRLYNDEHFRPIIEKYLSDMNPIRLGEIIGFRPVNESGYKTTHFLQTLPASVIVDTQIYHSGKWQLVVLAAPVIIAAMYDLLATRDVVVTGSGPIPYGGKYVPKKALRAYVLHMSSKKKFKV